jgi:hypothetical protein
VTRGSGRATLYRLRVEGHLGAHWATSFNDFTVTQEGDGTTTLTGEVADQAELHGLLARVRDLGLTLLSVQVHPSPSAPTPLDVTAGAALLDTDDAPVGSYPTGEG